MLWQDCVVEAAIAYHSTTQPPRIRLRYPDHASSGAVEPGLLMLVEVPLGALARVPSMPGAGGPFA